MLTVSDELRNAFMKDERTIYVRIKIGNRVFDNDNAISVDYDAGSLSGEVFAIGSTYSNSIKITFSELVEGLKELDEVTYEIGIKLPSGTIEYVPMGVFVINDAIEMDRNNNKTTIECMDRMVMMGGAYVSSLNYPAAIREVALEIANKAGVVVDSTSFARLSADIIAKPEGYTFREAIGLIAQFEAGFATFDRYGKLEIRTLSDPNFAIPPDNYFSKGLVKNEVFFRLGGISCTTDDSDTVIQSGNTAGNQVVLENRVMTKFLLDKIYQKIQTINYYPFALSWQGNPVLEAGDWVEVEDLKGNKFKAPNLSYSLSFNGGLSAKSSAETVTQSDATYQYKSPLQQKIEWIHARIDAAGGNVVYEGIDEPVNPKEGDLWFKIIGPDKEILIYKKDKDGNLFWDPQISTADIDKVAKEVEEAIEQIKEVEKSANDAVEKADQAIEEAGFAKVDAGKAKTDAAKAISDANKAATEAGTALSTANTAKTNAGTALTTAQTSLTNSGAALEKAGQALSKSTETETETGKLTTSYNELTKTVGLKADKTEVSTIKGTVTQHSLDITANATALGLKADKTVTDIINQTVAKHTLDIKATADGLAMKAEKALVDSLNGTVATHTSQIKATADGLGLKADKSLVDTVKGTVDTHTAQIKATSDGLALKAEKSLVDTINGTVNTHTSQIKATSDGLGLKADKTLVDTVKGTVDKHTTDIKANADGLKLKAEASAVNTLTGTVNTHTNQISANATAISARLTSAQVDSLVAGKNYVNQTTLNATANGLRTDITQVSTDLAGLEIGGRNLIKGTKKELTYVNASGWGDIRDSIANANLFTDGTLRIGETYTLKVFIDATESAYPVKAYIRFSSTNSPYLDYGGNLIGAGKKGYSIRTFTVREDTISGGQINVIRFNQTGTPSQRIGYGEIKIEKGTKATDWSPAPEDLATLEKVTSIEATVNGIQTTVASKADKSQITQLSTQISSKVESATYNSKMTQLDSAINLRVQKGDVIGQINVEAGKTLIQNKSLYLDAATVTFSGKAFIPSAAITTLTVDKLNGGTANFANFNVVNFNANNITSGTITGANSSWNLNSGIMNFRSPSTGDSLTLNQGEIQFQNGAQGRYLKYQSEGLLLQPFAGNTGTSKNTALHLIGGGAGSYQYIQFVSQDKSGVNMRLEAEGQNMTAYHGTTGALIVSKYRDSTATGTVISGGYETRHPSGVSLRIAGDSIETPRDGARNIYLTPQGTGSVVSGAANGTRYTFVASDFVKQSTRKSKTDIKSIETSGLAVIGRLKPVSYKKKDKIEQGIIETEIGFIAEDSLEVATPDGEGIYDSHITTYLVKAVQELNEKIKQLEEEK